MWAVIVLSALAGLIRSLPAASLIAGCTLAVLVIDQTNYWVPDDPVRTLTAAGIAWTVGETALAVVPAFVVGRLARYGLLRLKRRRDVRRQFKL